MAVQLRGISAEMIALACSLPGLLRACASAGPAPAALQVVAKVDFERQRPFTV